MNEVNEQIAIDHGLKKEEFNKICELSGMIVTKLDGTAKGGVILPIAHKYKLPIFAIGVGEQDDDLQPFDAENFTNTFLKKWVDISQILQYNTFTIPPI